MTMRKMIVAAAVLAASMTLSAQPMKRYTTTEQSAWQESRASLSSKGSGETVISLDGNETGTEFRAWGTCFNELDLDAYRKLDKASQDKIMHDLFDPQGDLRFTAGRLTMNANDYAREWYSCSEVPGDFDLRFFNIDHDKANIIELIHAAQRYNPDMVFFMSPWSPPAWMKINNEYSVVSGSYNTQDPRKDYILYKDADAITDPDEVKLLGPRDGVFPRRLATQDFFIQEPRYLQAYADMFCRFIDLYAEENIPITKVMYQNEAYSYTQYPGCAWTAEGTVRFNAEYLAPALKAKHPDVELWLGTFNTNRLDYVEKIIDNPGLRSQIKGIGTQWECRENLPAIHERYPELRLMCSESECGNGSMDWAAGEHTFSLISDNLGNGVDEYYIWNFLLPHGGISTWGWKQNALIDFNPEDNSYRYTAEYYAVKHFSNFVKPGDKIVGYSGREYSKTPVIVVKNENGYVVVAANFTDSPSSLNVKLGKKYLNIKTAPHSFTTFVK